MAWPMPLPEIPEEIVEKMRDEYSRLAKTIADFQPVTMLVQEKISNSARELCGPRVRFMQFNNDGCWTRDTGPIILINKKGQRRGVAFSFNGYGKYERSRDAKMAEAIAQYLDIDFYKAPFVVEGGAISSDGDGTIIVTEEVLLNKNRNPGMTRADIEENLKAFLGIRAVIWLPFGILNDWATDGHVDNVAAFVRPALVAVTMPLKADGSYDLKDPRYKRLKANLDVLARALDARGRSITVVMLPLPSPSENPRSYVNYAVINGAVLCPQFGENGLDTSDEMTVSVLQRLYPGRRVKSLRLPNTAAGGGGIHCAIQEEAAP